jgi:hypothetical protein
VYVDGMDALDGRGARRDGGHDRRGRALASASAKAVKRKDDDDDVGVTQGGHTWQCLWCGGR